MRKQDTSRVLESCEAGAPSPPIGTPAVTGPLANDISVHLQNPKLDDGQSEATASSCGDGKGRVPETARPLRLQCRDCEELLHQLSNVITPILMHAQMLEWKLPPYSHLKRSVRELERNARRGSELVKALMRRVGDADLSSVDGDRAFDSGNGKVLGETDRRPHTRV